MEMKVGEKERRQRKQVEEGRKEGQRKRD